MTHTRIAYLVHLAVRKPIVRKPLNDKQNLHTAVFVGISCTRRVSLWGIVVKKNPEHISTRKFHTNPQRGAKRARVTDSPGATISIANYPFSAATVGTWFGASRNPHGSTYVGSSITRADARFFFLHGFPSARARLYCPTGARRVGTAYKTRALSIARTALDRSDLSGTDRNGNANATAAKAQTWPAPPAPETMGGVVVRTVTTLDHGEQWRGNNSFSSEQTGSAEQRTPPRGRAPVPTRSSPACTRRRNETKPLRAR